MSKDGGPHVSEARATAVGQHPTWGLTLLAHAAHYDGVRTVQRTTGFRASVVPRVA